ncbi:MULTISPECIES: arsenite methyltransferase [Halorussus]|uniref:arsenite methyltransferase n=1 Tax=Halorussus TaxID=1070314 RepID=UPI000E20D8D1|nr:MULTISPECIES: arsenite methyltransferase [Halorussus]NHN61208.1 arsenite methyltransferase [Halorussus sp. JP-T4]
MSDDASTADGPDGELDAADQRSAVRERYGQIAEESSSCCGGSDSCGESSDDLTGDRPRQLGYSTEDVDAADAAAELSLGCGNPTGIASLEAGETVLDLGSGGGFDCFLAAREVGPGGRVVGVDMTPEMVETARENAEKNDATNVEFRLGEIEHLPVADETVDAVLSNCVVNLSPDKRRVFEEAHRVLRPGGRLAISDVVRTAELPADVRADPESVAGCVAGAAAIPELEALLADAGFADVAVEPEADSGEFIDEWDEDRDLSDYIVSATITGTKPAPNDSTATPN